MFRAIVLSSRRGLVPLAKLGKKFHLSAPLMTPPMKKGDYIPEGYNKLKLTQAKYQMEDGIPVFLKAGARDVFLYKFTVLGMIINVIWGFTVVGQLIAKGIPAKEPTYATSDKGPDRDC